MKFKVVKGTKLFDQLVDVQKEIRRVNGEARKLVESLGYKKYWPSSELAGGIVAIHCPTGKPEGWAVFWKDEKHCYMPAKNKKENKELWAKINALPVLEYSYLNDLLDYKPLTHRTDNRVSFGPGIQWEKDYVLLEFADYVAAKYKPVKDMIEILESEYVKLSKLKNKKVK